MTSRKAPQVIYVKSGYVSFSQMSKKKPRVSVTKQPKKVSKVDDYIKQMRVADSEVQMRLEFARDRMRKRKLLSSIQK